MSSIGLKEARRIIAAAEKKAEELDQPMNVAVVSLPPENVSPSELL